MLEFRLDRRSSAAISCNFLEKALSLGLGLGLGLGLDFTARLPFSLLSQGFSPYLPLGSRICGGLEWKEGRGPIMPATGSFTMHRRPERNDLGASGTGHSPGYTFPFESQHTQPIYRPRYDSYPEPRLLPTRLKSIYTYQPIT